MPDPSERDSPRGRRGFFRNLLGRALDPAAEFIAQHLEIPGLRLVLRPPGALPEPQFLATCRRSGHCVDACPVQAIRRKLSSNDQLINTPYIDADLAACVVCDDLACTKVCPSGALLPLGTPAQISMGLAEMRYKHCVRSRGEDCTICIERCPLGETAIRLDDGGAVNVLATGCVGCGVCQLYCPTRPKAIVVRPS